MHPNRSLAQFRGNLFVVVFMMLHLIQKWEPRQTRCGSCMPLLFRHPRANCPRLAMPFFGALHASGWPQYLSPGAPREARACRDAGASCDSLTSRSRSSRRVGVGSPVTRSPRLAPDWVSLNTSRQNSGVGLSPFPMEQPPSSSVGALQFFQASPRHLAAAYQLTISCACKAPAEWIDFRMSIMSLGRTPRAFSPETTSLRDESPETSANPMPGS